MENWYGFDDAIFAAGRLLQLLSQTDANADECFAKYPQTVTTAEIKIQTTEEHKFAVMQALADTGDFGDGVLTDIDGIRVDFNNGWGLIRPSNTSPVLSLRFEADTQSVLIDIQKLFQTELQKSRQLIGISVDPITNSTPEKHGQQDDRIQRQHDEPGTD